MHKADGHLHGKAYILHGQTVVHFDIESSGINAHGVLQRARRIEMSGMTARGMQPRLRIGWNCVDDRFHAWFCEEWVL